jgi:hypothetical protein
LDNDGNILYGRRYRILAGDLDFSQLRCTFKIEKSMTQTPGFSEISIYNLSAQTENTIVKTGQRVVLEAGYEGAQYGLIFDGDIVQPLRGKEDGTTYVLTLVSQDGDQFLNNGFVNSSFRAGHTPRDIANAVCSIATNPVELASISENLENKRLTRGKVCFGLARDFLRQISKTEQAAFYVLDGKVNIVKAQDVPQGRVIDLTPKSGLIGAPEWTDEGVSAKCLLNPLINLNTFVHIDPRFVREQKAQRDSQPRQVDNSGIFRVICLSHIGDTRGNDWHTEFIAVAQTGFVPNTGNSML